MTSGRLILDEERCIGCFACEVVCNQENDLQPGTTWIRFTTQGVSHSDGQLGLHYHLRLETDCTLCAHRLERNLLPACAQHCLARAIRFEAR